MNSQLLQALGWFGFLERPIVLEQLLCAGVAFALLALLRLRIPLLRRASRLLLLSIGTLLALALAVAFHRHRGLLLLACQLLAAFWTLLVVEHQLLRPLLPPATFQTLVSRFLRPVFLLSVVLVLLDAVAPLTDLATLPLGTWFGDAINLGRLFGVVVVMYLLVSTSALPANGIAWLAGRGLHLTEGSRRALATLLRYGIISLGLVWSLDQLGINRAGLLAVAGGLSVGLGFGVKEVFSNFISGLWLLIEGSVRPGEVLIHDGEACEVRRLDLRAATLLRTSDNAELVVPNQSFFTATTTTYTRSDRMRRCSLEVMAPSSWTPDQMIALLQDLATTHPQVLQEPPPRAVLLSFSPDSHGYRLSFSIVDPLRAGTILSEVKLALWRRFDEEGLLNPSSGGGCSSPAS